MRILGPLSYVPRSVCGVLHEVARHLLRRPVVGVVAVAQTASGQILLVRRADTGTWALPGGTLEWGETLAEALPREVLEETGAQGFLPERVTGVYSRPDRDPRFHAVTICVRGQVAAPSGKPTNPLEIREARLFARAELPTQMAMGNRDMLTDALADLPVPVLE